MHNLHEITRKVINVATHIQIVAFLLILYCCIINTNHFYNTFSNNILLLGEVACRLDGISDVILCQSKAAESPAQSKKFIHCRTLVILPIEWTIEEIGVIHLIIPFSSIHRPSSSHQASFSTFNDSLVYIQLKAISCMRNNHPNVHRICCFLSLLHALQFVWI